jgi:hypothetical protein
MNTISSLPNFLHRLASSCGLILTLAWSTGVIANDIYRWTDDRGVTHYSDKAPVTAKNAEKVKQKSSRSTATPSSLEVNEAESERCKAERSRLSILQSNKPVTLESRDGTQKVLSPEEIQQEITATQRAIERFCQPAALTSE